MSGLLRVAACRRERARDETGGWTPALGRLSGRSASVLSGVVAAACQSLLPVPALALWSEGLKPFVEEKLTRDDNIFRISKDQDPAIAIGSSSKGDTYRATSLGFDLEVPLSRQRLKAAYAWSDTRYSQFSYLDYTGYDGQATWLWEIGSEAAGELGYSKSSTLASFANTQSTTPDILKTQQGFFNAVYQVTPVWRLRAGVRGLELGNSDPLRQSNDIRALNSDVALNYVVEADASVGVGARSERGHFPNPQVVNGMSFDNDYRQYGVGVVGDWTITGVSRLSARADRVRRRYVHLPQRDFEGNAARLEYEWKPTGKLLLAGVIQRDISPYEDLRTSFAVLRGITLRPKLSVTEKIEVSGALEYSVRDFLGDPGLVSDDLPNRTDRVRLAAATVSYRPTRAIGLLASAQREIRTSNFPLVDYEVSVFSVSARITF